MDEDKHAMKPRAHTVTTYLSHLAGWHVLLWQTIHACEEHEVLRLNLTISTLDNNDDSRLTYKNFLFTF